VGRSHNREKGENRAERMTGREREENGQESRETAEAEPKNERETTGRIEESEQAARAGLSGRRPERASMERKGTVKEVKRWLC
jgi:hypothetical protein